MYEEGCMFPWLVSLVILGVPKHDVYLSEVPEPPAVVLLNHW